MFCPDFCRLLEDFSADDRLVGVENNYLPLRWHRSRLPGFIVHNRTRATGLYRSGVEFEKISVIPGHFSTQTTRIYTTPSVEMILEAMSAATTDYPEDAAEWEADENELARLCGLR